MWAVVVKLQLHAGLESETSTRKMGKSQKYCKWNNRCDFCLCHMTSAKLLFLHFLYIHRHQAHTIINTMRDRERERNASGRRGNVRFMVHFKPMQHENSLILTSFHAQCNDINIPFILQFYYMNPIQRYVMHRIFTCNNIMHQIHSCIGHRHFMMVNQNFI